MRAPRALAVTTALALSLTLAACGGDDGEDTAAPEPTQRQFEAGTVMATLQEAGKVKIGTKFDQPLFGLKGLSGDPEGFDVEVAKMIAAELGIAEDGIEWVESISKNRQDFIKQGTTDFIVATYTINEERDKEVDFAGPYIVAGQDLLVKKGNPESIKGVESLAGKTVCSQEGSTSAKNITEKAPQAKLVLLGGYKECADAMRDGTNGIVAVSTDDTILLGIAAESPDDFEVVGSPFTEEQYGIGVKEGEEEFCEFINEVIAEKVEDGSLQKAWDATAGKGQERTIEALEPWGCDT